MNEPQPTLWRTLTIGLFLLAIALPLPVDYLLAQQGVELPGRAPYRKVEDIEREEYFDGKGATKLEHKMLNRSYVGRWWTARHNEVVFELTGRTAPAAWLGEGRWLFVPQRVHDFLPSQWDALVRFDAEVIAGVAARLEQEGSHLAVTLIPDRARIYPDKAYRSGQMPPGKAAFLPRLADELRSRGVVVIDTTEAMAALRSGGTEAFYSNDHHWTSRGAEAAAQGAEEYGPAPAAAQYSTA